MIPATVGLQRNTWPALRGTSAAADYYNPPAYSNTTLAAASDAWWLPLTMPLAGGRTRPGGSVRSRGAAAVGLQRNTWAALCGTSAAADYFTPPAYSNTTLAAAGTDAGWLPLTMPGVAWAYPSRRVGSFLGAAAVGQQRNIWAILLDANALTSNFDLVVDQNSTGATATIDALRLLERTFRAVSTSPPTSRQVDSLRRAGKKSWRRGLRRLRLEIVVATRSVVASLKTALPSVSDLPSYTMSMIAVYLRHGRRQESADHRSVLTRYRSPVGRMVSII